MVSSLASVAEPGPPAPGGSRLDLPPCVFSVSVGSVPGWTATGASAALLTCPLLTCREPSLCRPTLSPGGFEVQRATAAAHEGPADPPRTGPRCLPEPVSSGRRKAVRRRPSAGRAGGPACPPGGSPLWPSSFRWPSFLARTLGWGPGPRSPLGVECRGTLGWQPPSLHRAGSALLRLPPAPHARPVPALVLGPVLSGDSGSSLPVSGMSHEPKSPSLGMLSTATRTTATVNPLTPSPLNGALVPSGSPATSSALSAQAAPSSSFAAALRKLAKQAEEPRGKRRARPGQPAKGGESTVPPGPQGSGRRAGSHTKCPHWLVFLLLLLRGGDALSWLLNPTLCAVC